MDTPVSGFKLAPITIEYMLVCCYSPVPAEQIGEHRWNSIAGRQTRRWLARHGLIDEQQKATPLGHAWLERICATPIPDDDTAPKSPPKRSVAQPKRKFNQRLREMRIARNLSQAELARLSGVDVTHISHMESGRRLPAFDTFRSMTLGLGCTADELLGLPERGYEDGYRCGISDAIKAARVAIDELRVKP